MSYQLFISYKHGPNGELAAALENALRHYARPTLAPPMRIFRDERYFVPGLDLPAMIRAALEASTYLLLIASPGAAASPWVRDELDEWCGRLARSDRLIIVHVEGHIAVDPASKEILWERTDALPTVLRGVLDHVPLYVDLTSIQQAQHWSMELPAFKQAVNLISARLRGVDPGEMFDQELAQHRRNLRLRNAAVLGLALSALLAGGSALRAERALRAAEAAEHRARAGQAGALAALGWREIAAGDTATALRLGLRAALLLGQDAEVPERSGVDEVLRAALDAHHERLLLAGHEGPVSSAAFDGRGERILSGGWDGTVRIWDAATGEPLSTLDPACGSVAAAWFTPEDRGVVAVCEEGGVVTWADLATPEPRRWDGLAAPGKERSALPPLITGRELEPIRSSVFARTLLLSPNGEPLARSTAGGAELPASGARWPERRPFALSPDGVLVALSPTPPGFFDDDPPSQPMLLLRTTTGQRSAVAPPEAEPPGRFLGRDRILTASSLGGILSLPTRGPGSPRRLVGPATLGRGVNALFASADDRIAVAVAGYGFDAWLLEEGRLVRTGTHGATVTAAALSADGTFLALGSGDGAASLWAVYGDGPPERLVGHRDRIAAVAFSPRGDRLVTASWDGLLRVWSTAPGHPLACLDGLEDRLDGVPSEDAFQVFDPGSHSLLDATSREVVEVVPALPPGIEAQALFADGTRMIVTGPDGRGLWDVKRGRRVVALPPVGALDPHGEFLVSRDGTSFALIDATDGAVRCAGELPVHHEPGGSEDEPRDLPMVIQEVSEDGRWMLARLPCAGWRGAGCGGPWRLLGGQSCREIAIEGRIPPESSDAWLSPGEGVLVVLNREEERVLAWWTLSEGLDSGGRVRVGEDVASIVAVGAATIVTASEDGLRLDLWSRAGARLLRSIAMHAPPESVALDPGGHRLAAAFGGSRNAPQRRVWEVDDGQELGGDDTSTFPAAISGIALTDAAVLLVSDDFDRPFPVCAEALPLTGPAAEAAAWAQVGLGATQDCDTTTRAATTPGPGRDPGALIEAAQRTDLGTPAGRLEGSALLGVAGAVAELRGDDRMAAALRGRAVGLSDRLRGAWLEGLERRSVELLAGLGLCPAVPEAPAGCAGGPCPGSGPQEGEPVELHAWTEADDALLPAYLSVLDWGPPWEANDEEWGWRKPLAKAWVDLDGVPPEELVIESQGGAATSIFHVLQQHDGRWRSLVEEYGTGLQLLARRSLGHRDLVLVDDHEAYTVSSSLRLTHLRFTGSRYGRIEPPP